jgi:hypothetical protein
MKKAITMAVIAAFGFAAADTALADEGVSYSYLEGGYVHSKLDDLDVDGSGFGIQGSYAFAPHVHGFAAYSNQDFDFDVNIDQWEFGAGVNFSVSPKLDVVGRLAYVGIKAEIPGFVSADDSGVGVSAELRSRLNDTLELHGGVSYVNLNDTGDGTAGNIGARVFFTKMFALGADASFDNDGTTFMLGARLDFGNP